MGCEWIGRSKAVDSGRTKWQKKLALRENENETSLFTRISGSQGTLPEGLGVGPTEKVLVKISTVLECWRGENRKGDKPK